MTTHVIRALAEFLFPAKLLDMVTPLPGQYEYCPGSDAISWAIRVLLLRGAVTADNSEAAPLKVGLLGLQVCILRMCVSVYFVISVIIIYRREQFPL